jgi:TPR repeat protein
MGKAIFLQTVPGVRSRRIQASVCLLVPLLLALAGCVSSPSSVITPEQRAADPSASTPRRAEELFVVDCLLPGQIRKLGRMTFLTPRRPVKTAAQDCEIRGGEYVAYDRADYRTALNVWLPQAQEGDKEAQTYVGEIYEKGLGLPPDYGVAAAWYRKAAAQGHTRAQINLGHLYEKGLGVEKDSTQALYWYRQASGLQEAMTLDSGSLRVPGTTTTSTPAALQELRQEVERWKQESASLRQQLAGTQQQLEQTRQDLERRQQDATTAQQQLDQARQELARRQQLAPAAARDDAETKRLEAQLQQREAELARQQQEVVRLQHHIASLQDETTQQRQHLAKLEQPRQQVALAGPTIEIVDPPLTGTRGRGLSVVPVSSNLVGQTRVIVGKVTAPAGVLTLTVNDHSEKVDDRGLFRAAVPVQSTSVPVTVVAVDQQGQRTSVAFTLESEATTTAARQTPLPEANFGIYHALLIGNETYTHWPALKTPEHDAVRTAQILSKQYGFKTKVLLNATRFDILQALNDYRKTLTDKDNLLVYYAGHGHWEAKIERGYWIPVDGHTDSDVNWISTFAITDILSAMSAKHVLVVADSCYSGALTRSALARLEAGMSEEARRHWLQTMAEKRSRTVLSSGGLQPVLDSGGGDHSVFAKAFLDTLANNKEILEGQRLSLEIAARVSYAAAAALVAQDPQYAPIRYAGHEAGDFLFIPTTY